MRGFYIVAEENWRLRNYSQLSDYQPNSRYYITGTPAGHSIPSPPLRSDPAVL
jgi:hypothetical protein